MSNPKTGLKALLTPENSEDWGLSFSLKQHDV
jgi:hypothetical protein